MNFCWRLLCAKFSRLSYYFSLLVYIFYKYLFTLFFLFTFSPKIKAKQSRKFRYIYRCLYCCFCLSDYSSFYVYTKIVFKTCPAYIEVFYR